MTDADKIKVAFHLGRAFEAAYSVGVDAVEKHLTEAMAILSEAPREGFFKGYDEHGNRLEKTS